MQNILNKNQFDDYIKFMDEHRHSGLYDNELLLEGVKERFERKSVRGFNFIKSQIKKELELLDDTNKRIHDSTIEIEKNCNKILKTAKNNPENTKFVKNLNKTLEEISNTNFDIFYLIGKINLSFVKFSAQIAGANLVDIGIIFTPIRNIQIIKIGYQLFIAYIKRDLQKYIYCINLAFTQFQTQVIKAAQSSDDTNYSGQEIWKNAIAKLEGSLQTALSSDIGALSKSMKALQGLVKDSAQQERWGLQNTERTWDAFMYSNIYDTISNEIKQTNQDAANQEIDSLKSLLQAIPHGDEQLGKYATIVEHVANVAAQNVNQTMANNFLKLCEIFKVTNQKNISDVLKQNKLDSEKAEEEKNKLIEEKKTAKLDKDVIDAGKKIFDKCKSLTGDNCLKYIKKLSNNDKEVFVKYIKNELSIDKEFLKSKFFADRPYLRYIADENLFLDRLIQFNNNKSHIAVNVYKNPNSLASRKYFETQLNILNDNEFVHILDLYLYYNEINLNIDVDTFDKLIKSYEKDPTKGLDKISNYIKEIERCVSLYNKKINISNTNNS